MGNGVALMLVEEMLMLSGCRFLPNMIHVIWSYKLEHQMFPLESVIHAEICNRVTTRSIKTIAMITMDPNRGIASILLPETELDA